MWLTSEQPFTTGSLPNVMNRLRWLSLLCLALSAAGCDSQGPPRGSVKGRVTYEGRPLAGVTVVYESAELGVSQTAATDDDGRYAFSAYNAAGLPVGSYKVAVTPGQFLKPGEEIPFAVPVDGKAAPKKTPPSFPVRYTKAATSGFFAEVKAGDNHPFDFDLSSAK
jgi:hypothetical protein